LASTTNSPSGGGRRRPHGALFRSPELGFSHSTRCPLEIVDDIDADHARLVAADVPFVDKPHIVHRDGGTQLWMTGFMDRDGYTLVLMEERTI
jgi:hypothetical protein